jgi:tRNA(Ile)-lysidine synthase
LTLVERTIREHALIARGDTVLLAVSGGPDSMAMMHVLARLAPKLGARVVAHGIDHGLRQEAAAELALAAQLAASLEVPFRTSRLSVAPGANLMARARAARSEALERAKSDRGASVIATAHHADDRAETVLLRLLRGTGPAGLAVLPPRAGDRIRPLAAARRADIVAHLTRHRIAFAEDPSNRDPRFLRTRVRHELLPLMRQLSPRIDAHLCALADAAGSDHRAAAVGGEHLGRAQRLELARAVSARNSAAQIRLKGGKVVTLDLCTDEIVAKRQR